VTLGETLIDVGVDVVDEGGDLAGDTGDEGRDVVKQAWLRSGSGRGSGRRSWVGVGLLMGKDNVSLLIAIAMA
jgi:hypothetical protein